MTASEYIYSKENLLVKPQKYKFTKFEGIEFLYAYIESRKKQILRLNIKIPDQNEIENILHNENKRKISNTEKKLTNICLELINEKAILELDRSINFYLKKFEVTKKIFSNYDTKKEFQEYKILQNYILLSLILIIKYKKIHDLRFINTILKLNDTICSSWEIKNDTDYDKLFSFCLESEMAIVKEIMSNARVIL
tara:strand:+ start:2258 stop:2842 length:585 start_codon:yes stop_codon:yes gene_type:complete